MFLVLSGCSTPPEVVKSVIEANEKIAAVPTFSGKCSAGCEFNYTDPRDRKVVQMPTNGWDFGKSLVGSGERVLSTTAPWITTGLIVRDAIKNSGHNTTYTNSGEGSSVGAGTTSTDRSVDSNDRIFTDNTDNTDNTQDIDNTNNSNQNNRTADPTIVYPTVVNPVVVNPVVVTP